MTKYVALTVLELLAFNIIQIIIIIIIIVITWVGDNQKNCVRTVLYEIWYNI